jgi:SOS regulatory protein LexA
MTRITDTAEKIAQLRAFNKQESRAPSYAEMAELFGYQSKNAAYKAANKLIELNYLSRSKKGNLTFTAKITGGISVLGTVQAGFPSPAEEELVDTLSLDEFLVKRPEATFLLTVSGDSMIDAGIHPRDLVLVEKGGVPKQGDIVIAQVDGDWTMKYFGKDKAGVYLEPANSKYTQIRPERSMTIGGIVKAVVRKYA